MRRFSVLILLLTLGCTGTSSDPQLSKEERSRFQATYVDLLRFYQRHDASQPVPVDSLRAICAQNGLDQETYNRAMDWTSRKPKRWRTFYRKVSKALTSQPPAKSAPPDA